jgi:hypothetical protein
MTALPADGAVGSDQIITQLTEGDAGPVLVADFQAFSNAPRLSHMLSSKTVGRPVYRVDPLDFLSQGPLYASMTDMADATVGPFLRSGPADGPVTVVGYCSASGLALRIAALLAPSREVSALLLRPSWPSDEMIQAQFAKLIGNLSTADRACPDLDGDPADRVAAMEQILRAELEAMAASRGLSGSFEVFLELLLTYRSWLSFLLACRNDSSLAQVGRAAPVAVLAEPTDIVSVPGLAQGAFGITPLPVLDEDNPITDEVVEIVAAQIKN